MFTNLVPRFLRYVKVETRSNPESDTIPSTETQIEFAEMLLEELEGIGLSECEYHKASGCVLATLPSNTNRDLPTIGFLAHMDTADFNAVDVNPRMITDYDGESDIPLDDEGKYILNTKDYPNLKNYKGETLITTDGTTLLGADDKAGIAEIVTAMEYLINNPEIEHGEVRIAFTPDEEIGTGSGNFDVENFRADFAYTVDGGPLGELQFENFNAATARVKFLGTNVHPGTAKDKMVNSMKLAMDFHSSLPEKDAPEHTEGYEGFFQLEEFQGGVEETNLLYLIRDHDLDKFNARKESLKYIGKKMNRELDQERVIVQIEDSYFNMREIIEKDMTPVELAQKAMENLGIEPKIDPVRGGTDGARLSFKGLPTPNLFAGGENLHGRFEFVSIETMRKATQVIIEIIKSN